MKKICIIATVPFALNVFMKPHIDMLAEHHHVTLIASGLAQELRFMHAKNIDFINVNISRKISLLQDFITLIQLYKLFRKEQFDVVHSLMPKTALLGMLAAFFARVPHRVHTFTGQVWANESGIGRRLLIMLDKIIAMCATNLLTDSFSQRQFLIEQHIVKQNKITVLGNGSVCGVDTSRFKPNPEIHYRIRNQLGIPKNAIVYLYLGRLNRDKGIQDLAQAFKPVAQENHLAHLLIIGPDEGGMDKMLKVISEEYASQFHRVGFTDRPEDFMASADIFCLPSYREGFGSVIIEAASVGIPAIASNIYGLVDAVKDGETGILHPPNNIEEITRALFKLMNDDSLREKMSKQAMVRSHILFSESAVVDAMHTFYQKLLF